ncbi:MAG: guanylate kinase [Verrucomicrobiales bacterium]|nr:guanylate kinase [Verrucomicrobiales bacterium]
MLLVTGPSGSGKTTATHEMLARFPGLSRVITCTTRPPREGERPGVDYHFLSREEFEQRGCRGDLLEQAQVYGNHYGTPRSGLLAQLAAGQDLLLNLDVQGAATLRALQPEEPSLRESLVTVFLTPATREELDRRLRGRGTDEPGVIARRLAEAHAELQHAGDCDYLVYSTTIGTDLERIAAIYEAERWRRHRVPQPGFGPDTTTDGRA